MFEISIVCGHLTADAAFSPCKNGSRVMVTCRLASDRYDHTARKEVPEFHAVKYFAEGKYAESLAKRMKKGALVFAVGERVTEDWQDKDGNTRRTQRIHADHIKVVADAKSVVAEDEEPDAPDAEETPPQRAAAIPAMPPPPAPQFTPPPVIIGDTRDQFKAVSFK